MASTRSLNGASSRSSPSTCNRSKKNTRSGVRVETPATSVLLAVREAITWKASGRPSSRRASTSPSSTSDVAGSSRTAATTSGSRAVISSSERVKIRTRSSRRCTWTRMPSSLTSATAGLPTLPAASLTSAADAASIGWMGVTDLQAHPLQRVLAAVDQQPCRRGGRGQQHRRPPNGRDRHAVRLREPVLDEGVERPLPELTEDQAAQQALLRLGGATEQVAARVARALAEPDPASWAISAKAASTSITVSVGVAAGGGSSCSDRQPKPGAALPQAPSQVGHDDLDVVRRSLRPARRRSGHASRFASGSR